MILNHFEGYIIAKVFVVDRESKADILVFAVDHDYKADLLYHEVDKDYKAKWKKSNAYQNRL